MHHAAKYICMQAQLTYMRIIIINNNKTMCMYMHQHTHHVKSVTCICKNGGPIKKNKGVNLPGGVLDLPALTEKDKKDLRWAVQNGADFIAASFIRSAANVRQCIAHLERCCDEVAKDTGYSQRERDFFRRVIC
jgi:pyruvate kinase